MGLFLVGITTSLPALFHVTSAALQGLPDIAVGSLLGASMVNYLLLTELDDVHPRPLTVRADIYFPELKFLKKATGRDPMFLPVGIEG